MHVRKLQFRKASKQRRSESKGWLPTWSVDSSICSSGQSPYAYHEGKICMCTAFDWIEIWFHLDIFGLGCVLLLPLQCDSANEKPDIRLRNSSCSPKWLVSFCVFQNFSFSKASKQCRSESKEWLRAWSVYSSICSSGQSPYAYHEGKIHTFTAFGLKSDFIWTYLVSGVCYFFPCSVIVQTRNRISDWGTVLVHRNG